MYTQIKNLPVSTFSHTLLFHNLEKFNSFSRVSLCPYVIHTIRLKLEIHCEHATFWFCKPNKKRKCLVAKNRKAPLLLCTFLSPICVLQEVFSSSQWEAAQLFPGTEKLPGYLSPSSSCEKVLSGPTFFNCSHLGLLLSPTIYSSHQQGFTIPAMCL